MIKLNNDQWLSDDEDTDAGEACGVCGGLKEDGLCPDCEKNDTDLGDDNGSDDFNE